MKQIHNKSLYRTRFYNKLQKSSEHISVLDNYYSVARNFIVIIGCIQIYNMMQFLPLNLSLSGLIGLVIIFGIESIILFSCLFIFNFFMSPFFLLLIKIINELWNKDKIKTVLSIILVISVGIYFFKISINLFFIILIIFAIFITLIFSFDIKKFIKNKDINQFYNNVRCFLDNKKSFYYLKIVPLPISLLVLVLCTVIFYLPMAHNALIGYTYLVVALPSSMVTLAVVEMFILSKNVIFRIVILALVIFFEISVINLGMGVKNDPLNNITKNILSRFNFYTPYIRNTRLSINEQCFNDNYFMLYKDVDYDFSDSLDTALLISKQSNIKSYRYINEKALSYQIESNIFISGYGFYSLCGSQYIEKNNKIIDVSNCKIGYIESEVRVNMLDQGKISKFHNTMNEKI